jgi:hypothetical protein
MVAKLSALVSSKVALAALGGVLVLGGAGAVAAAETGHLPAGIAMPGVTHDQNSDKNGDPAGHHGHTVPIHGTLTAAGASGNTITVTGKAEDQDANKGNGKGKDKGTPSATCSLKSPFTIALTKDTKIDGQAKTEADLAKHIGSKVEVQATEDASCHLTAWKVTVGGHAGAEERQ